MQIFQKEQNKKIKKILEIVTKMLKYNKYKNEVVKNQKKEDQLNKSYS